MDEQKKKMTCDELTDEMMLDYEEGELPNHVQAEIHEHLEACEKCRIRAHDVGVISAALGECRELSHDVPVPPRVDSAVFDTIAEVAGSRRRSIAISKRLRWFIPLAAVVLIAVFAGLMLTGRGMSRFQAECNVRDEAVAIPQSDSIEQKEAPVTSGEPVAPDVEVRALAQLEKVLEREKEQLKRIERQDAVINELAETLNFEKEKNQSRAEAEKRQEINYREMKKQLVDLQNSVKMQDEKLLLSIQNGQQVMSQLEQKDKIIAAVKEEFEKLEEKLAATEKQNAFLRKAMLVEGDLNKDGMTDVSDAMVLLDSIISGVELSPRPENDLNGDGKVDIGDVLSILNKTLME